MVAFQAETEVGKGNTVVPSARLAKVRLKRLVPAEDSRNTNTNTTYDKHHVRC